MRIIVTGGASSGKSEIAEQLAQKISNGSMAYIATMACIDNECLLKIKKHQAMRKNKGFTTIEATHEISQCQKKLENVDTVLIECLSNLLANELFIAGKSEEGACKQIFSDINVLSERVNNIIIVSNDIFSDMAKYDEITSRYVKTLGFLNSELARSASVVIESVCSIPIIHKGGEMIQDSQLPGPEGQGFQETFG